jgi:hypothetical protein
MIDKRSVSVALRAKSYALSLFCVVGALTLPSPAEAQCIFDPVGQHLASQSDARSKRAAQNLAHLCTVPTADIKASEAAKKCLGANAAIFSETDAKLLKMALGKLSGQTLKVLLPTVAAVLGGPVVAAAAVFFTPTEVGKDAIDVISRPASFSRDDLHKAAKLLLWDTDPPQFLKLSGERKASISACIFAQ